MPAHRRLLFRLSRDPFRHSFRDSFRHGFFVCCALPAGLVWAQPGAGVAGVATGGQGEAPVSVAPAVPPRSALWLSVEAQRHQPAAGSSATRRLSQDERALMRAQIRDYHGVRASAVSAAVAPEQGPSKPSVPVAR